MVNWQNPYENLTDIWLKGNLHTHTAPQSPCGLVAMNRVLELYEQKGYDFLSISDHQFCSTVDHPTKLITIPGLEWNSRLQEQSRDVVNYREHLGIYSLDRDLVSSALEFTGPEETISSLQNGQSLIVLNHPNWLVPHHYSEEELFTLYSGCDGLEIYNAVINRHPGVADATMKWDRVLTDKGPILGFASDDSHMEADIGNACIMVNVERASSEDIFARIKVGAFYCSTGVVIQHISRYGDLLTCQAESADVTIEAIGENGQIFSVADNTLEIDMSNYPTAYIRFTLYGNRKEQAWTQPFFRKVQN